MNRFLRRRVEKAVFDLTAGFFVSPDSQFHADLESALLHHRSGRMHMAAEIYRKVLEKDPTNKEATYLLAIWHLGSGEYDPAGRLLQLVTTGYPEFALGWAMYGSALESVGRFEDAEVAFEQALKIEPKLVVAHFSLGCLAQKKDHFKMAIGHFRQSSGLDPQHLPSFIGMAECHFDMKHYEEAMSACHRALLVDKRDAVSHHILGQSLLAMGQVRPAADSFRTAVKLCPGYAAAYCHLGEAHLALQEPAQALEMCIQAIELDDEIADAHIFRGLALIELGRLDEAIIAARNALAIDPQSAPAYYVLGSATLNSCLPEESVVHFRSALDLKPDYSIAHSRLLQAMQCCESVSPEDLLLCAEDWGRKFTSSKYSQKPQPQEIKRIGFIGSDMNLHPIGCYVEGLLKNIDREKYQVYVYANSDQPDALGQRLKDSVFAWRRILGLDDDTVTTIVNEDNIDVLIDLSGHTLNNRLQILANHAAPIQISWLGYQGTTGLPQIDAVIGDESVTPQTATGEFAEKLIRLDGPWVCYTPPTIDHDVVVPPCSKGEPFTFGAFCHTAKVNRSTIDSWAKIMVAVPGSRILLKSRSLVSASLRDQLLKWFRNSGISSEQVIFRQSTSWALHFASFDQVDLMLDTYPFNSATTTLESIWMGVPVLTREGKCMHSRLSARILEEVDLLGFVTDNEEDYISRTVALAHDVDLLCDLRQSLRNRLLTSRICNVKGFADQFMEAIESLR